MLDQLSSGRPDLTDVPLTESEAFLFTDGSSQVIDGTQRAKGAVTTETKIIWIRHSKQGQLVELIALIQALRWAKGKKVNT